MENLPKDILFLFGLELDIYSLLIFSKTYKRFNDKIVKDENFWKQKMIKDYPLLLDKKEEKSWKDFYFEMIYYIEKIKEKYDIPYIPIKRYNPKYFFILKSNDENTFNVAMSYAAEGGHINIVKMMIEKGAREFNTSMSSAAEGGHINIVKMMIEKGARHFNNAMCNAAYRGQIDMVKFMIEKGATDFNTAMVHAEYGGHIDIVEYLKEKTKKINL